MIYNGDAAAILKTLPGESVHCCVTSPPYFGLRDYGVDGQIGLEETPEEYINRLVEVFREVKRVLRNDGTLWLNIGDSYSGSGKGGQSEEKRSENWRPQYGNKGKCYGLKPKDLIGIPWMLAFALRADGWYLRQDIIWQKPNPMPESVTDRCTKSHEYIFLFSKSRTYFFDAEAIAEPVTQSTIDRLSQDVENQHGSERVPGKTNGAMKAAAPRYGGKKYTENPDVSYRTKSGNAYELREKRNKRDVWNVATQPYSEAHFATFPKDLIRPCILAGCPVGGIVLDPFFGSGTTGEVALEENRNFIGIELNPEYIKIAQKRISEVQVKLII
jgi:DNA modification methylase